MSFLFMIKIDGVDDIFFAHFGDAPVGASQHVPRDTGRYLEAVPFAFQWYLYYDYISALSQFWQENYFCWKFLG